MMPFRRNSTSTCTSIAWLLFALAFVNNVSTASARPGTPTGTLDSQKSKKAVRVASLPSRDPFLPAASRTIKPASTHFDGSRPPFHDINNKLADDAQAQVATKDSVNVNDDDVVTVLLVDKQQQQQQRRIKLYDSPIMRNVLYMLLGFAVAFATCIFSNYFPYVLTPTESNEVYQRASYNYDPVLSFFDNTAWTYATNYANMGFMLSIVASIVTSRTGIAAVGLQRRACGLLLCYAASVGAGAIAHQNFFTLESRNTITFRLLWTVCVGTVTLAGGFMGACGSQVAKLSNSKYVISEWFWAGFGCFTTAVCCAGYMSFQRPACDIFVAGITQFPPTVYICLLSILQMKNQVSTMARYTCVVGFVLLVPLLPLYAVLLYHTDWSLARINTLLHCCLCMAWSTQGLALRHFSEAANANNNKAKKKEA